MIDKFANWKLSANSKQQVCHIVLQFDNPPINYKVKVKTERIIGEIYRHGLPKVINRGVGTREDSSCYSFTLCRIDKKIQY
jgi:hypothetical protein